MDRSEGGREGGRLCSSCDSPGPVTLRDRRGGVLFVGGQRAIWGESKQEDQGRAWKGVQRPEQVAAHQDAPGGGEAFGAPLLPPQTPRMAGGRPRGLGGRNPRPRLLLPGPGRTLVQRGRVGAEEAQRCVSDALRHPTLAEGVRTPGRPLSPPTPAVSIMDASLPRRQDQNIFYLFYRYKYFKYAPRRVTSAAPPLGPRRQRRWAPATRTPPAGRKAEGLSLRAGKRRHLSSPVTCSRTCSRGPAPTEGRGLWAQEAPRGPEEALRLPGKTSLQERSWMGASKGTSGPPRRRSSRALLSAAVLGWDTPPHTHTCMHSKAFQGGEEMPPAPPQALLALEPSPSPPPQLNFPRLPEHSAGEGASWGSLPLPLGYLETSSPV